HPWHCRQVLAARGLALVGRLLAMLFALAALADAQGQSTASIGEVQARDVAKASEAEKKQQELRKRVATAHKPVYYLNDFSYVLDPADRDHVLGDGLKRRSLAGRGRFDVGGEYRLRHHSERNMRGLGLTGNDDDFLLRRLRLYGNV